MSQDTILLPFPSSMRAAATTVAEPAGAFAGRFLVDGSLPCENGGSAFAFAVSKPACSAFTRIATRMIAEAEGGAAVLARLKVDQSGTHAPHCRTAHPHSPEARNRFLSLPRRHRNGAVQEVNYVDISLARLDAHQQQRATNLPWANAARAASISASADIAGGKAAQQLPGRPAARASRITPD